MLIEPNADNTLQCYHALVDCVCPRPIAWVTTISEGGIVNLAPFSFFNAFGANPPVVAFSPTLKRDATKKDTLRNIEATREFVVHSSVAALAEQVNLTSRELLPEESEVTLAGLHTVPSLKVKPPRIAEAPTAFECKLIQVVPVGNGPISANIVIGEIVAIHIDDKVLDAHGRVDPRKLQPVARLGGDYWCRTTDLFEQKRP